MAELTGPLPSLSDMIACGLYDYSLRAVVVDPAPGNRGLDRKMKGETWACSLTSFDHARPMVKVIRHDPAEADKDARLRFMALFSGRRKPSEPALNPVSDTTQKATPKSKVAPVADLDDDAASLI